MSDHAAGVRLVIGVVLGVVVLGIALAVVPTAPPVAGVSLAVDGDRLTLTKRAGPPLDVRGLNLTVRVDGEPLAHQPPVPFFAAPGFESGPTGPFNPAADPRWQRGERASLGVAGTNRPTIDPGDRVTVALHHRGRPLVTLVATA